MPRKDVGPETLKKVSVQEFLERSYILAKPGKTRKYLDQLIPRK